MTDLDVVTGELVPVNRRITPAEAAAAAEWVREMKRAVLVEGVDYGTVGDAKKPTLWKSGAEALLTAAGFGFNVTRLDDEASAVHEGVTYRCTVVDATGMVRATCDGYAGYDESRFHYPRERRADWNTVVKMAQKRAMVGAVLNACAASGLFVADIDDTPAAAPPPPDDPKASADEKSVLFAAMKTLPTHKLDWLTGQANADGLPAVRDFHRSHRDRLAWHILVALDAGNRDVAEVDEPTPKAVYDDAPDATPGRYEDGDG